MTTGNNAIIIAVLDEGVSPDHPDLPNIRQVRLNGSNFGNGDPNDPSPQNNNNHGNSSAGLIAASQNNNEGISGIAPNCRIMPVRIFNGDCSGIPVDRLAAAIDFARLNGADIISNSWGFINNATNPNLFPVIVQAIQTATTQGRGGLGCVVVFSAGNNANHAVGNNGTINFPSNVNIAGVLTVGASERDDFQANYSPTSNPASGDNQIIDIVAPSHRAYPGQIAGETLEVWTIDIPGNVGYNPWPTNIGNCQFVNPPFAGEQIPGAGVNFNAYTARFGGTSAACPQVAAVAALVLSMNTNLTQQQVFDILTNSADDVGGYIYTNGRSNELGGGRLNACAAVTQTLAISGPDNVCTSETYTINLPAGATVSWSVSPSGIASASPSGNSVTLTRITNGSVTLTASVTSSCANISKPITVGLQTLSVSSYVDRTPQASNYQYLTATAVQLPGTVPSDYSWYEEVNGIRGSQIAIGLQLLNYPIPPCTTVYYQCVATTSCGEAVYRGYAYNTNCGGYAVSGSLAVYPNPASTELNISNTEEAGDVPENGAISNTGNPEFLVRLYNEKGNILRSAKNPKGSKGLKLDIAEVPNGTYYLHISKGKEVIRKQIIIQH